MDKEEKERLRQYGQLVCGFINAKTTDEACLGLIENVFRVFDFPPLFAKQIQKRLPLWKEFENGRSAEQLELLRCFLEEKEIFERDLYLIDKLTDIDPTVMVVVDYDRNKQRLTFAEVNQYDGKKCKPIELGCRIDFDIDDERIERMGEAQNIAQLWKQIQGLKERISEGSFSEVERLPQRWVNIFKGHEHIKKIQQSIKFCMSHLIKMKEIPPSVGDKINLLGVYNNRCRPILRYKDNSFHLIPPFLEYSTDERGFVTQSHLFRSTRGKLWYGFYETFVAYCLVEFLKPEVTRKLVRKCEECGNFFVGKTARAKRFCPAPKKCKDNWHYRKRKESGYLKEYKRSRRADGLDQ